MTPKPAAGLGTEVVNDKGRYHSRPMISFQHEAARRKHFVELDNRKARNLPQGDCQRRLARPSRTKDNDALHISLCRLHWGRLQLSHLKD
jgi:hypothetical protein